MSNNRKCIWLTGASSGIGEAFATLAAKHGYCLALTARRVDALEALKTKILLQTPGLSGEDILVVPADVVDESAILAAAKEIEAHFPVLDILVAGAGWHRPTNMLAYSLEQTRKIFEVNFFGTLNCLAAVIPGMLARKSGHLVAISSVASYRGLPHSADYCASKAALTTFMESSRFELEREGITVSVVSPGFVKTPLTDANDFPMPFMISAGEAAEELLNGIEKKSYEIHFPKRFTILMKLLRVLPFPLFQLFARRGVKKK